MLTHIFLATAQGFGWETAPSKIGSSLTSGPVVLGIGTVALAAGCFSYVWRHEIQELAQRFTGTAMIIGAAGLAGAAALALFATNGALI